jgi:hypothetical protein
MGSSLCVGPWVYYSIQDYPISANNALAVSSLVGCGPIILSVITTNIFKTNNSSHPVHMSFLENLLHLFFGLVFCGVPLTYGSYLTLS